MRQTCGAALAMALLALPAIIGAGEPAKVHRVGKDGLTLPGEIVATDAKVKVMAGNQSLLLPAKRFEVELAAGKRYRVTLDSDEIDSVLVVQDANGKQIAWDDDSGGGLNSLLTL